MPEDKIDRTMRWVKLLQEECKLIGMAIASLGAVVYFIRDMIIMASRKTSIPIKMLESTGGGMGAASDSLSLPHPLAMATPAPEPSLLIPGIVVVVCIGLFIWFMIETLKRRKLLWFK